MDSPRTSSANTSFECKKSASEIASLFCTASIGRPAAILPTSGKTTAVSTAIDCFNFPSIGARYIDVSTSISFTGSSVSTAFVGPTSIIVPNLSFSSCIRSSRRRKLPNLPSERQTAAKPSEDIADDDVRRAVNRTIHTLKNANSETPRPIHTARLLYMILDNEKFLNIEKLNEALRPYWPTLWRMCARGHYLRHEEPLRDGAFWGADSRLRNRGPLPSFQEGEYRLEFHRGPETEFSVWLYFPGRFALQYPLYDYRSEE